MATDHSEHGISQAVWFQYLEGSLPPGERAQVDTHLDSCAQCRHLHHAIRLWERVIQEEASRLASDLPPDEIDRLAAGAIRRIRETEPPEIVAPGPAFFESVLLLRGVLDPLCGTGAARNAIQLATTKSFRADAGLGGGGASWRLFVQNLASAIGAVYGIRARVLVEHVGGLAGMGGL